MMLSLGADTVVDTAVMSHGLERQRRAGSRGYMKLTHFGDWGNDRRYTMEDWRRYGGLNNVAAGVARRVSRSELFKCAVH